MILNKYSSPKEGKTVSAVSSSGSSRQRAALDRTIWGQEDDGTDIDGDLYCGGNIYITESAIDDDDEPEEKEAAAQRAPSAPVEMPSEAGNLYVENSIIGGKNAYAPELYLDYENKKTNVLDLFKAFKEQIEKAVGGMIPSINLYGSERQPVVLMAGKLVRSADNTWGFKGQRMDCIGPVGTSTDYGLMTVSVSPASGFSRIVASSCFVMQAFSGDTESLTDVHFTNDGNGSHWFEARISSDSASPKIYIREFHQASNSSSAWASNQWDNANGQKEVQFTLFGYAVQSL